MADITVSLIDGWTERGDGFHWDHTDGCFVEKAYDRLPVRYALYNVKCGRLGKPVGSLLEAYRQHSEIKRLNPERFSAFPTFLRVRRVVGRKKQQRRET